jgi:hypothetical protein
MLVFGTANPEGFGGNDYGGVYLTDADMKSMVPSMAGIPIKIEHRGIDVGQVVSAWQHDGRMDVVFQLDNNSIESALASRFVVDGYCKELSLGYKVEMTRAPNGHLSAQNKRVVELSLVKQGARDNCKIRGFQSKHKILI